MRFRVRSEELGTVRSMSFWRKVVVMLERGPPLDQAWRA